VLRVRTVDVLLPHQPEILTLYGPHRLPNMLACHLVRSGRKQPQREHCVPGCGWWGCLHNAPPCITPSVSTPFVFLSAVCRYFIAQPDVVGVLAFKDDWAQVEFVNAQDRSFTGWISQDQYARLVAPKS